MLRLGIKPGQWGWRFDELTAAWERIERLGFHVVSCFDHVTAEPRGNRAWDAPTLLAAMAGRTQKITLAIDVVNVSLRHPFLLAAQLAVVQAASRGRLEVGLGAGSYGLARFDHQALGIAFPPLADRLARLDGCVRTLPRLWRGETVTDPQLDLHGASLGPLGIEPPLVIVGGASPRLLETAVRYADGWNVAWSGEDMSGFIWSLQQLRTAMAAVDRPTGEIEITVGVFVLPDPGADSQYGRAIVGDPERVAERLRAYSEAGADLVIVSLAPAPFAELDPSYPDKMAEVLRYL